MGNLTAKTSGELANFMSPSMTNIKSLKVHFSPKQLGTGDPSPENVREIEGWDGVEAYNDPKYSGNIVWNQCFDLLTLKIGNGTSNNFNVTKLDTGFKVTTNTDVSGSGSRVIYFTVKWNRIQNHRYIFLCKIKSNTLKFSSVYFYHANGSSNRPVQNSTGQYTMIEIYTGSTATTNTSLRLYIYGIELLEGESFEVTDLMAIDLDMMFGTTVIDNLFNNTTTSLQRVDWFTSIITNYDYHDYNEGEITTVSAVNNEPYTNLSIDWSSNVGTVYGGYVDLISGELVETIKMVQFTWGECEDSAILGDTERRDITFDNVAFKKIGEQKVKISNIYSNFEGSTAYWDVDEVACMFANSIIMCKLPINSDDNTIIQIAGEFKTPITHQLTPTQLKSFTGQNNFWSNADYVEVEYDLIETIDIQKAKQKIILNQPQLKTISNKVVSFNTDMVAPMKNCKIYFNPIQLGSGDASITNFRDIKGWTGIDAYVNGDKISVDWTNEVGTRYSGYIDLVKGELVIDWIYFLFSRSSKVSSSGITSDDLRTWMTLRITHKVPPYQVTPENGDDYGLFSIGDWRNGAVAGRNRAFVNATYVYAVITDGVNDLTTTEGRTAFFDQLEASNIPIEVVYKRATPLRFQLTPQQLLTLKSTNHIWSETNGQQIDVTYWTRKNLTTTPLTNYLENQTWTDSAYISSSGKKTTNTVSASHFLTNQILLEAGTYVLSGFSYYVGTDSTRYRIHAYDSTGKWVKQITFQEIGNLSPVDISFTLDTDTYVNVSIAMDFDGVLAKIS